MAVVLFATEDIHDDDAYVCLACYNAKQRGMMTSTCFYVFVPLRSLTLGGMAFLLEGLVNKEQCLERQSMELTKQ